MQKRPVFDPSYLRLPLLSSSAVLTAFLAAQPAQALQLDLSSLNGSNGFRLNGITAFDESGRAVRGAGDVNGDGLADLLIGAPYAEPNGLSSGQSYVVFGRSGGFGSSLELSSLDGRTGFRLNGIGAVNRSGFSVSGAGDVNGDGFADLLIGARLASPNGDSSGQSYMVFGRSGGFGSSLELSSLDGRTGFQINGSAAYDLSGTAVSRAGDVNGDGVADLLIGAPLADPNGGESGQSYVVFGRRGGFGSSLELSSLDGSTGFQINGIAAGDGSGSSVSGAGDVNGDGVADLLIGAPLADPNSLYSGQSYVVFGRSSGFGSSLELSSLDGATGFRLNGIAAGDVSGGSVSGAGDVNGDGFADLLIGANYAEPNGPSSGQSYVVFGRSSGFGSSLELFSLNGTTGFRLNGIAAGDRSGISVSGAGDVNGDGLADLLIGAFTADPNGSNSGQSYVVFGRSSGFMPSLNLADLLLPGSTAGLVLNGIAAGDQSGRSVSGAGDVNGDGFDDLLIGANYAEPNGSLSGQSYVVFGFSTEPAAPVPAPGTLGLITAGLAALGWRRRRQDQRSP